MSNLKTHIHVILLSGVLCFAPEGAQAEPLINEGYVQQIEASGFVFDDQGYKRWDPENILFETSKPWCPKKQGDVSGEWIKIQFNQRLAVGQIDVINGNALSGSLFKSDGRVKDMVVEFSDGSKKKFTLNDTAEPQTLSFKTKSTDFIKLTIQNNYPSEKYPHTCLNELIIHRSE